MAEVLGISMEYVRGESDDPSPTAAAEARRVLRAQLEQAVGEEEATLLAEFPDYRSLSRTAKTAMRELVGQVRGMEILQAHESGEVATLDRNEPARRVGRALAASLTELGLRSDTLRPDPTPPELRGPFHHIAGSAIDDFVVLACTGLLGAVRAAGRHENRVTRSTTEENDG